MRRVAPGAVIGGMLFILILPVRADAYIGPGAGFAVLSSFLVVLTTILMAIASIFTWVFRTLWRIARKQKAPRALVQRLIIVGFDGQDPKLTDRFMRSGDLPNFSKLAEIGSYTRLQTTFPSISPAAWSSFSTGVHPARHNIFDFLDRDRRTYLPILSSTHIGKVKRFFNIGRYRIPQQRPEIRLLRKSKPFWTVLGEHGIRSTVLRVPITFPPDRFYGAELSAMCVPDLLGTQGTFLLFTTRPANGRFKEGGRRIEVRRDGDRIETAIQGPENAFIAGNPTLTIPMTLTIDRAARRVHARINGATVDLEEGKLSDWIRLTFKAAPGVKISGIARFQVLEMGEHFSLYVSPVNLDPDNPAMPISHPSYYATYLSKRLGAYSTLGLAEDTWALNESVTSDATFLQQAYDIDRERQSMFFSALDRQRRGALICVFDGTDRIQHMFWRYLEDGHPAAQGRNPGEHRHAIRELYKNNDALIGRVMKKLQPGDVLMILSDHGFSSFRRGVNLNAWLHREGYLALRAATDGTSEWLRDVDWSKSRAYCVGLTGMFFNVRGREGQGIVAPADVAALKAEIIGKLTGLRDNEKGQIAIREAFDPAKLYSGPYLENGPDVLIGYNDGYRTSWDCATGIVSGPVFEDNVKAWSGDHCVDPRLVPGVFFCSQKVDADEPHIVDLAPTALRLFGIEPPAYMEGKPFGVRTRMAAAS
jgi:predicted AlkP superfamily phosphohydrolase/phosphomutase